MLSPSVPTNTSVPQALHRYAIGAAVATLVLVIAGGLVTSTGSGLAVPDWPLSFGRFFPPMVGGILYEHGHRMIAGAAALMTMILAAWLWRTPSSLDSSRAHARDSLGILSERPSTRPLASLRTVPSAVEGRSESKDWAHRRWLGIAAVAAVLAQAVLGGLTVLLQLPTAVSVGHACLGQGFFCVMVSIALVTSSAWARAVPVAAEEGGRLRRLALMTTVCIAAQLVTGAILRHTGGGITAHVLLALLVALHILLLGRRIMAHHQAQPLLRHPMAALGALLVLQLLLGIGALLATLGAGAVLPPTTAAAVLLRTAHVAVGALLLASSLVITLCAYRLHPPERSAAAVAIPTEVWS